MRSEVFPGSHHGACYNVGTAVFYCPRGASTAPAAAFCAVCLVRAPCLEYALRHEKYGFWGGTGERTRRRIRRDRGITVRQKGGRKETFDELSQGRTGPECEATGT
ncbi:MAG: WhiB family transcriptional regulator [Actinomycetia bacterium]|nr:WhiB family transcriptional regulator [Actinomycetes bacterium]